MMIFNNKNLNKEHVNSSIVNGSKNVGVNNNKETHNLKASLQARIVI